MRKFRWKQRRREICVESKNRGVFFFLIFFVRVVGGRGVGEDAVGSLGMIDAIGRGNARVKARRKKW